MMVLVALPYDFRAFKAPDCVWVPAHGFNSYPSRGPGLPRPHTSACRRLAKDLLSHADTGKEFYRVVGKKKKVLRAGGLSHNVRFKFDIAMADS